MSHLSPGMYVLLFFAGVAAGIMNTVAGGGSVITLPVLIFAGLPAGVANATNRIGLIAQNITAVWHFKRSKVTEGYLAWRLTIIAAIGAIIGVQLAVRIPDEKFEKVLGFIMLGLLALLLARPKPHLVKEGDPEDVGFPQSGRKKAGLIFLVFLLGIYAGFIQAGMGIMVVLTLSWFLRIDLVRANYIKLVIILGLTFVTLGTFIVEDVPVEWIAGIATSLGGIVGASIGSWVAIKKGEKWIVAIMVVAILLSSAKLLGVLDWLHGLVA